MSDAATPAHDALVADAWLPLDANPDANRSDAGTPDADRSDGALESGPDVTSDAADAGPPITCVHSVRDYGAMGDGTSDDTAAVAAGLAAEPVLCFPAGVYRVDTMAVPAHHSVVGLRGAVVRGRAGSGSAVVALGDGASFAWLEVDGDRAERSDGACIAVGPSTGVTVSHAAVHDCAREGIAFANSDAYQVTDSVVHDVGAQCISIAFSQNGTIDRNEVFHGFAGIEWWGGDSRVDTVPMNGALAIVGNHVHDIVSSSAVPGSGGCIWGSLGEHVTVTDNVVAGCGDVGIDFEGCQDATATGNQVSEAANGALTTFYGSSQVVFRNNVVTQSTGPGVKFYSDGRDPSDPRHRVTHDVDVEGNTITVTGAGAAITTETAAVTRLLVHGNRLSATGAGLVFIEDGWVRVLSNQITVSGPVGVFLSGTSDSTVADNTISTSADDSHAADGAGGVLLYRIPANPSAGIPTAVPAVRNVIQRNTISGFFASVNDDCNGDLHTGNAIESNHLETIYRRAGDGYDGTITGNVRVTDPTVAVSPTVY